MHRFLLPFLLLGVILGVAQPASAQKIIEKNAKVASGQRVVLELKFGNTIRIRPATDNQLHLRATVNINSNKLNDALQLSLTETASSVTVTADLDKKAIDAAQPGDCPPNSSTTHFGNWDGSNGKRNGVCTEINYEIQVPAGADVQVNTISGNIEVAGLTGPLEAKSISGFVDVSWPPAKGAALALKTITGEVYTDQEVAFENRKERPIVGYQLRGALASGNGPLLKLESISGDVFFRKPK
ncbi:hypothetical protein J0X19_15030 [Hymenobacter sp. BT186]|uniref:Adhesin domain-containing protein n=1 Tax=Hymenobacter telluris TaxID=2816474 RepID=A0A939J9X6_9BACT|nr:hypothetical protein [Hymenobacter telluris]MBO0359274.1 hypothetical protein [Hymenobacter telluris]MBW3375300.1 DUF4097 domain-containing protein [Hymenobacter norwichensis]